ncbi:MAG TPA: DUF4129 domain-containing protein, partial [Methylomirabilota bacterium]|nr:DUF4129 domain-containing protein [Methylomirabilota bacterium]
KRGFRPEPAETARQFGGRVSDAVPAWAEPVASLTLAYERTRFGAVEPRPDELAEIERTLAALEHS